MPRIENRTQAQPTKEKKPGFFTRIIRSCIGKPKVKHEISLEEAVRRSDTAVREVSRGTRVIGDAVNRASAREAGEALGAVRDMNLTIQTSLARRNTDLRQTFSSADLEAELADLERNLSPRSPRRT